MPRFNSRGPALTRQPDTTNLAGGQAYQENPKLELVSLLVTSFVQDQFYRSAGKQIDRLGELVAQVDPAFAMKAAVYARDKFHTRSITHALAAEVAIQHSGVQGIRSFMRQVVVRPDDATEIGSYYMRKTGRRNLPASMRAGFRERLARFDSRSLSRYRGDGHSLKLVDLVRLTHPRSTDGIKGLVYDTLRAQGQQGTWEAALSEAGKEGKAQAWADLLRGGRLGQMALLRNLRNIAQDAPEALDIALEQLVDRDRIHKSRILPFRYMTAADQISLVSGSRRILEALGQAADIALEHTPQLDGRTLVVLDGSGSMYGQPFTNAAQFGAAFYKMADDPDLMLFSNDAHYANLERGGTILSLARQIENMFPAGGTNFNAVFERLRGPYDRILIVTDEQGWMDGGAPRSYRAKAGMSKIVVFDVSGYGTLQFPEKDVIVIPGLSEKVMDLLPILERDREGLIHEIEAMDLAQA